MSFTPLRVHSHGSLLHGVAAPEALVTRALELGYGALALTDRDNLYLAVRFYRAAHDGGLAPIVGCTLTSRDHEVVLLAVDRRGYAHLCELITGRRLNADFDLVAALAPSRDGGLAYGLHVIVESAGLAASLVRAGVPAARGAGVDHAGAGADGGVWIGIRGTASERPALAARIAAARELGVPLVATGDVLLLDPSDHETHRVAVTAAAGELLDRMPERAFGAPDAVLDTPAAWERRIRTACASARLPTAASEALANNRRVAERCRLTIDLGTPIFPRAPLPPGVAGGAHLRALCDAGLGRRYGAAAAAAARAARARLDTELGVIDRMGFTDYFLLVAGIVGFARERGIPTVGRGSGASSIVAYVLGITNVDPIRYGLTFERFLHPARRDCPDLDIDLCWWRRDEVIDHVYATYGRDRVAMISTHATVGARSAFRETAKALGVPNGRVNALARAIPRDLEAPYADRLRALPGSRHVDWNESPLPQALALAERLDGAPRHLSIHSGGLVIADRPLTYYVPLERAAKQIVVTQFEMRAIEAIGLVKMDLLGNRALSTIAETVELAREAGLTADHVGDGDAATAARLEAGDTLNCFQLESPAMRHLLRMLRARSVDDTIAAVALVRPGPAESGMKEAFCRRARGVEPAAYLHPALEPVLAATHGVMLYEEDVMRVAAALTGISLAEGDDLRRAVASARGDDERAALEHGFVLQAASGGIAEAPARAVWQDLTRFAAYSFCKAHAAGYGTLGFQCTWLKVHFPVEFAVAILNHHAGMYATWVHVEDLRRNGVRFLPPSVARSEWRTTLERCAGAVRGELRPTPAASAATRRAGEPVTSAGVSRRAGRPFSMAVRVGLGRVFGLHEATGARIVAARAARPFASLADLLDRARPTLPEVESLILAGALDDLGRTRPSLLLEARAGARAWIRAPDTTAALVTPGGEAFLPDPEPPVAVPDLPEFDAAERVRGEAAASGLWFSGHPLDALPPDVERSATPAADVERHVGRSVTVVGMPCAYRRVQTKNGQPMLFMTLADRTGLAECVLFPDVYAREAPSVRAGAVRVRGRVSETLGAISVDVQRVEPLANVASPDADSHRSAMSERDADE